MKDSHKLGLLVTGVSVTGATQRIIVTFLASRYPSMIFVILMSGLHFILFFGILLLVLTKAKYELFKPLSNHVWTVVIAGIFNGLSGLFSLYASNPVRTPAVVQSVLPALAIIPSVIMTKYILKKQISYNKRYIVPSLLLLFISIGISVIPVVSQWYPMSIVWILIYIVGTILRSGHNIMQEKYITDTEDNTFLNRVRMIFYIRLTQFAVAVLFSWLDIFLGYSNNMAVAFIKSFDHFGTNGISCLLLEIFTGSYICMFIVSVSLNAISTNYNMIATAIVNPSTAIFYTIFPDLNPGLKYPIYIVAPALILSILSVILWIKGQNKVESVNPNVQTDIEASPGINKPHNGKYASFKHPLHLDDSQSEAESDASTNGSPTRQDMILLETRSIL
jgi:hypothetical protein